MRLRATLAAAGVAALLVPAGCGDEDGTGPVPPGTVVMRDYEFDPRRPTVRRGAVLSVLNRGGTAHNLKIERGPDARRRTRELAGTRSFLRGERGLVRIDLPPGRYAMVCTVPGHRELGMTGTLTVR